MIIACLSLLGNLCTLKFHNNYLLCCCLIIIIRIATHDRLLSNTYPIVPPSCCYVLLITPNLFCFFSSLSLLHAVGCFPLDQSIQAGCSLSFLCRYDLPLPPNVYLNGSLLLNFRPSTDNSSVTSPPCTNEHCVIPSTGKITGNMVLIKLSQPLLGCQNGLHLKIEYKIPFGPGCRIAKYEQVSTLGESLSCNGQVHASSLWVNDTCYNFICHCCHPQH